MTGFGRIEQSIGDKTFLIDIKSLNGKQFELNLKMPSFLKAYEFEIRKILSEHLGRGTIECLISLKQTGSSKPFTINTQLVKAYYQPLAELSKELNLDASSILSSLLKLPEVITPTGDSLSAEEWEQFTNVLKGAISNLNDHRADEGRQLQGELLLRITNITKSQQEVSQLEPLRQQKTRDGLLKILHEQVGKENYDENRLEQELIYYIEKMDITEELVRLRNHCEYFTTIVNEDKEEKGKKLSFILQEIGREINTTGAKAYDATIQKVVVNMKDELEKAKEQVLNVL